MPFPARRIMRYVLRGALALVLLVVVLALGVAMVGGNRLARTHETPAHRVEVATDPAGIAEGGRLAAFWGCVGCHGRDAGGRVFFTTPVGDRIVAPNLTRIVREYSVEELEQAIRHGTRRDGSSLAIMPSSMFAHMNDRDLGRVIGYLRSLPPVADTLPEPRFGMMARSLLATGVATLEAEKIDHSAPHGAGPDSLGPGSTRADTLALGRYLAHTGCPECHGQDLRGSGDGATPDLRIAAAYSPAQFRRLMREGIALDGQERELMTEIAVNRVARLTDDELSALRAYLATLAE